MSWSSIRGNATDPGGSLDGGMGRADGPNPGAPPGDPLSVDQGMGRQGTGGSGSARADSMPAAGVPDASVAGGYDPLIGVPQPPAGGGY